MPTQRANRSGAEPEPVGRVAALDLGKVRVGVAVSDEHGMFAHPRPALAGRDRKTLLAAEHQLLRDEEIEHVLVGYPLNLSGEKGSAAHRAARFAEQLASHTGVGIELVDERLSTVQATEQLRAGGSSRQKVRQRVDSVAAALLLQQWLDARRNDEPR